MAVPFGDYVAEQLRQRGWNYSRLAERSGLHVSLISRVVRGEREPSANFVQRLAAALELPLVDIMSAAGLYTEALGAAGSPEASALAPYVQYAATPDGEAELQERLAPKLQRLETVADPSGRITLLLSQATALWSRFQQSHGAVRALIGGALLYLISPVDLVPDFMPVAGLLDDLTVLTLVTGLVRTPPAAAQKEASQGV